MFRHMLFGIFGLLLAAGEVAGGGQVAFSEDFRGDLEALRERGWHIPDGGRLIYDEQRRQQALELHVTDPRQSANRWAQIFIPVEPGNTYAGLVKVRTEGVQAEEALGYSRGAVFFLQFADAQQGFVSGGSYPIES